MAAVGRALVRRGHRVTFFHVQDLQASATAQGLEFSPLGERDFPLGALPASVKKLSELTGRASLKYAVSCACRISDVILRDGPGAMRRAKVDVLLADQNEPAGGTVAEHLKLPFVSVCTSLPLNHEVLVPPPFVPWSYTASPLGAVRNAIAYTLFKRLIAPINETLNCYRRMWHLRPVRQPDDCFSPAAQIAQMPREFDFPRRHLPGTFHYLGPWFDRAMPDSPFPFEKLDGRPLIYGSIGTLQSQNSHYFHIMAEACAGLDAQLVLALGHSQGEALRDLPGQPLVVNFAPQIELLSRAAMTITHAGMNTMQQSLYFGVPAVAIPLAHDQPAIAARLARTGAGIVLPPKKLTVESLRNAVRSVLPPDSRFRAEARRLGQASRAAGGVERAAEIAEQAARV